MQTVFILVFILAASSFVAALVIRRHDKGIARYFKDQAYHYQTLRALNDIASDGADTAEVLQIAKQIRSGDAQGWCDSWSAGGDRVAALAHSTNDRLSKGRALLRAHNYYRTAEFFLPPDDPRRPECTRRNVDAFYAGLDTLGVKYKRLRPDYEADSYLDAVYYPAEVDDPTKPLIVVGGGFDSTLEELYFVLVKGAHERGYSVLTYDGPGQGSVLREQGLAFTHEWEKPVRAVLDDFLAKHPKPSKIVLVGMSMGGYLAPRAAAFDDRIDAVVAYDVFFDMGPLASSHIPKFAYWLVDHGFGFVIDAIVKAKRALSPGFEWATANGMWTMGANSPLETVEKFQNYTLQPVAGEIKGDVLILAGTDDHFVSLDQVEQFEDALTSAHSVNTKIYDRLSGGSEHCQMGAQMLWHADFFDWMRQVVEVSEAPSKQVA